jgi:hypothetical protein
VAEEPNFLSLAFRSQYNLIGLGTAVGFSVLSLNPLPLILAAGAELVILPLVAASPRYQRLVRARMAEQERTEREARKASETQALLRELPDGERQRYRGLETLAAEIRQNYKGLDSSSQMLLDELVRKLDFLLSFYLRMRQSVLRYESYFATTDPKRIEQRIRGLEREAEEGPARIKEVKARTRNVLEKRLVRYRKAEENRQLVDAQTETVQEVLQLLRDQSYSMRDPRSIAEQLDGLVSSAEETERGVRDMEEILSADQDALLPGGLGEDVEAELAALDEQSGRGQPERGTAAGGRTADSIRPRVSPAAPPPIPPPNRRKISQ